MRTILFVFGGRRPNIELAWPFYERITAENPDVDIHIWDLARDPRDSKYLRTLAGDRITVQTAFHGPNASIGQVRVWKHYTAMHYRDCRFVKVDDDVVFLETGTFGDFVASITDDTVTSALTINNGACTPHLPDIWDAFQALGIPLLDVHLSAEYAELSHRWFFQNWPTLVGGPNRTVPTTDWLSINCIGYTWSTGRRIAALLGTRPPAEIAGRPFTPRNRVGDEGAANMLPRRIHTGFVASHFAFGPTVDRLEAVAGELRIAYARIAEQYLSLPDAAQAVLPTP